MKARHDLSLLDWRLSGWTPHLWRLMQTMELGEAPDAEIRAVPARVPGSVQQALREARILPDWNVGVQWRACEWVENRHWMYETVLPDHWIERRKTCRLRCLGLDYSGWVYLNGQQVGAFCGTHVPHCFDLTPYLADAHNLLRIVFDLPPRWLGQFGFTSQVRDWKVRFNYTWDWQPRLVQIGIWDDLFLEVTDGHEIAEFRCTTDADPSRSTGYLRAAGRVSAPEGAVIRVTLARASEDDTPHAARDTSVFTEEMPAAQFNAVGMTWRDLPVDLWWPNLEDEARVSQGRDGQARVSQGQDGGQPLYTVQCALLDRSGTTLDRVWRRVGFRNIAWRPCENAPEGADPWLCVVNGRPVFLQGVNCPPLLPNFADVTEEDYRKRLELYRDLGVNTLRINGVGFLEKETFYNLCDELGLMIWQDVPLSSSGVDNNAPEDEDSIREVADILRSFILRRQHHPALLLWCGGNELHTRSPEGYGVPLTTDHPMIRRLNEVAQELDPSRRFLPTTATGPRFNADAKDFGKGLHWNVHGPWKPWDDLTRWAEYWQGDDALFRAETGAPGASPADLIRQYAGDLDPMPVSSENPVWRRPLTWWIEAEQFVAEHGRAAETLEEYVAWSQARQARALSTAVQACKDRFPRCGGVLLWCGHDCFPCAANTSIIDFHGNPKPAALALRNVWRHRP